MVMPNDAKLGLVIGVGVVITLGVVYDRREPTSGGPSGNPAPAASTAAPPTEASRSGRYRPRGRTVARSETASSRPLLHVVEEGETLPLLAERYFGTADRQDLIRQANAARLHACERLTPGLELVIPERP